MHLDNKISEFKTKVISKIMLGVRSFNEKHRGVARVTTVLALILIVILSVLFTIAEKICYIFGDTGIFGKRALGIVLAAVLLFVTSRVGSFISPVVDTISLEETETTKLSEAAEEPNMADTVETEVKTETTDSANNESSVTDAVESKVAESAESASTESTKPTSTKDWDTSDTDLASFMKEYPETVGWIYFEDGNISYPIMQSSDNAKYKIQNYKGDEVREGAIFLDHRSAPDFTDANSIIYGHNMKDGTMFGGLRQYRDKSGYYKDHQYFQVILPDKTYRYQIFAYMDVPQSYEIYDYVGDASKKFVEDTEPVRLKSYLDSEIPVEATSNVVTLSTCTDKDSLQFVVIGVKVDETE